MIRGAAALVVAVAAAGGCRGSGARAQGADDRPDDRAARPTRAPAADASPARPPPTADGWGVEVAAVALRRARLARRYRAAPDDVARRAVRREASAYLRRAIVRRLIPPWLGMPWGMGRDATAIRPHQPGMKISCSYFVGAILGGAGVHLADRFRFAQAPALVIQRAVGGPIHRFLSISGDRLSAGIRALGDGVYLIGLDVHIGFVVVDGDDVRLVHASYTDHQVVTDEPLATAAAIAHSRHAGYFVSPVVVASDDDDELVDRWLTGRPIAVAAWRRR